MKDYIIIVILALLIFILTFYFGKKTINKMGYEEQFLEGLKKLWKNHNLSQSEAMKLEQLYRNETAHFTSGQFTKTFSPGMEKFSDKYPYGWNSLHEYFWNKHPENKPIGFSTHTEGGTGFKKEFLKFPNLYSAMNTMLHNARMRGGNFYAWYSLKPSEQAIYKSRLDAINPRITNKFYNV